MYLLLLFAVMSESFKARDIGLRAQKKILSRMANKNIAKVFIDDTTASLLDNVYKLAKAYVSCQMYSTWPRNSTKNFYCPRVAWECTEYAIVLPGQLPCLFI